MKVKFFDRDMNLLDIRNCQEVSYTRQKNKEYSISFTPVVEKSYDLSRVYFVSFLDDSKGNRLPYSPCGKLVSVSLDGKCSAESIEKYLADVSVLPDRWQWWKGKSLKRVIENHVYGFRTIRFASESELNVPFDSHHIDVSVLENGNGEVFAGKGHYWSENNPYELYFYSDGYVIYRIEIPTEARRQDMVLRWGDVTGGATDIMVRFAWSDDPDSYGEWTTGVSPIRGEGIRPNETEGIDIPESDKKYLFVRFNLQYDTGTISTGFPRGINYSKEITTNREDDNNYVYYGTTAILNYFEIIYRVDTFVQVGTVAVSDSKLLGADVFEKENLLESLKAISEAYNLVFFCQIDDGAMTLNCFDSYVEDRTNEFIISDTKNMRVSRKDVAIDFIQAVEAYGAGSDNDRIHAFVEYTQGVTVNNVKKFEDSEAHTIEELRESALQYIENENNDITNVNFEYYAHSLSLGDKVKLIVDKSAMVSVVTEEKISATSDGIKKEYVIGVKEYPFRTLFANPFGGSFLEKPETPKNFIVTRMSDGWHATWKGETEKYILRYKRSGLAPYNTHTVIGQQFVLPYTEYEQMYEFVLYAVSDKGVLSDSTNILFANAGNDTSFDRIMDELEEVKHQSKVVVLELSSSSVTRNRLTILEPNPIVANAKTVNGAFNGLFVLEATYNHLHWQTVVESSEPESSREFNLPVTITVDDEQHFAVSFRVSVREALETIIDDETVYSTGDLFAQKDIAVVLNADARPIYWGARDTYPVGNLQVGDFYFDTNTQELDGGVLRVWTGSAWVLFNPNDSTYANAFNIAVTDIMVWVREHGVENFVAINAIFESIGASRAFITVLEAHELKLTGTFSGGGSTVDNAIISIKESFGVVNSSFHGTGKNDLSVVEESAEKGFVEVKVLSPEVGDQTPFGGTIFDTSGKEIHSDRLQEQDWNVAKSWAEETRSGKAWRLPTRAELSLINPSGAWWTGETSGDEVYLWEDGSSELVGKQGLVDYASFFNASRKKETSQLVDGKLYIPEWGGTALEIIDTTTDTVTTLDNFFNASRERYTSQLVGTKIYIPEYRDTALEIIDTTNNTVTTYANFFNTSRYRRTSQIVEDKIYVLGSFDRGLDIIDTSNNTVTTIADFFNASRNRYTIQLVGTKIYIPQHYGTTLEIINTTNNTVTTIDDFFNARRYRNICVVVDDKIYIPEYRGTALEIIDTTNNTVTTYANFFNISGYRYTRHLIGTKIYITSGTALEIIDTTNNTVTTLDSFFNASRKGLTSQLVGTKIYIPDDGGTALEIIHLTANTLPVRNNTETQRRQVSSSSDGTTWTIRSTDLITAGQTFTSYFGLKLRFAGDTHKVGDYWRYEQDEMGAFSLQDSSGEEYVRAMNGQLHVKTLVGELAKPKFTGKIKTEKAMNKVIFYDENDEVVNPVNAIAGLEIGDVVWIKYEGYDKLHTVELLEAGYMIVNYEHCDTRGKGSLMLEDKTNVSATVELLTKWFNAPIGLGQAWVDVVAARVSGATYTNDTGRCIMIYNRASHSEGSGFNRVSFSTEGIEFGNVSSPTITGYVSGVAQTLAVPHGHTYSCSNASSTVWSVLELR